MVLETPRWLPRCRAVSYPQWVRLSGERDTLLTQHLVVAENLSQSCFFSSFRTFWTLVVEDGVLWKTKHCLDRAALWITGGEYSKSLTSFLERSPQNISKGSSKKAQADCATHPGQGSPVLFWFLVHMCTCGFVVRKAFGVHGFLPPEWHTSWCFRKWSTDNMWWIPVLNAVFWLCMWLVAAMSMKN